jgi:glycosyltransferase involved in cell wall biosynthesis
MDLLMVTDRWDEEGGGRERYFAQLRTSLTRRGHSVAVLTRDEVGERQLPEAIEGFRRRHPESAVLSARPARGMTHYQLLSGVYAAAYAAEGNSYDSALRRLCFRPALRLNRRRSRMLRVEKQMVSTNSGARLMAFSEQTRNELRNHFGIGDDQITLERPGVPLDIFHPLPPKRIGQPDQVQLLFAGHNFVLKGLRWVLEALAQARRREIDARLVVAGRGAIGAFRATARRLNVATHVHFAGDVSREALVQLYRASDLLLHPTFYDPYPFVIVEALATGVPVVTTRACGGAEIITPGRDGFVVSDPRQVDALTDAIVSVADPDRRAAMGTAAAATGRRFGFEAHVDAVEAWLARS